VLLSDPEDLGRFLDELAACRRGGQRAAGPVDDGESGGHLDLVEHPGCVNPEPEDINRYVQVFDYLRATALSPQATSDMLAAAAEELA